jgi:hypothetical protein
MREMSQSLFMYYIVSKPLLKQFTFEIFYPICETAKAADAHGWISEAQVSVPSKKILLKGERTTIAALGDIKSRFIIKCAVLTTLRSPAFLAYLRAHPKGNTYELSRILPNYWRDWSFSTRPVRIKLLAADFGDEEGRDEWTPFH